MGWNGMTGVMIFMGLIIVVGIIMLVTGHTYFFNGLRGINPEDEAAFSRASGICNIVLGSAGFGFIWAFGQAVADKLSWIVVLIFLIVMIGAIVGQFSVSKKFRNR